MDENKQYSIVVKDNENNKSFALDLCKDSFTLFVGFLDMCRPIVAEKSAFSSEFNEKTKQLKDFFESDFNGATLTFD